jgi:predicted  nucleic acid-binding Zn-ribbon protein
MANMAERDLEQDVNELKERTARLDGWREGEAARYERLERDVGRTRDELTAGFERMDAKFDRLDSRIDRLEGHFLRGMWLLVATLLAVLGQFAYMVAAG